MKFYDIADKAHKLRAFNIIIGGRGIGKTYSALSFCIRSEKPFIYLRNTDVQIKESCTDFGNPFKTWARDNKRNIYIKQQGKHAIIYERVGDEIPQILGYAASLSTAGNLRGVDLSDVETVLYDEFIEKQPLKFKQFDAFMNFYETVNRNRELFGKDPLKVIMLSNAQKMDNEILHALDLIPIIESMIRSGQSDFSRDAVYLSLPRSEISEAKKNTAAYIAANKSAFYKEAIENEFANDNFAGVQPQPLREYVGVAKFDDLYIYKHKSMGKYYICSSRCENVPEYNSRVPYMFIRYIIPRLARAYSRNNLYFEDFICKSKIVVYF